MAGPGSRSSVLASSMPHDRETTAREVREIQKIADGPPDQVRADPLVIAALLGSRPADVA